MYVTILENINMTWIKINTKYGFLQFQKISGVLYRNIQYLNATTFYITNAIWLH
jgi:hypothetical protein